MKFKVFKGNLGQLEEQINHWLKEWNPIISHMHTYTEGVADPGYLPDHVVAFLYTLPVSAG